MDHDDTDLTAPTDDARAVHRIAPSGELDLATIDPVRDDVDAAIALGATAIVIDLTDVTFLDSSALAVFAYAVRQVDYVQVTNPNSITRRVIEETGLADVLHLEP
jgi:anti-sigma B factor antagonist